MISYTHAEAGITDVEEITLEPVQSDDEKRVFQRSIEVRTKQGDTFQLVLRANKRQKLRFHRANQNSWLTPILPDLESSEE
jgi:hypothetical protein